MIYIIKKIYTGILLLSSITLAAQKNGEEELYRILGQIRNLEAQFTQRTFDQHQDVISEGSGNFQYKRPNLVRWITHDPMEQHIVINGKKVWVYDPDLRQVLIDNFSAEIATSPLFILLSTNGDLGTLYSIQRSFNHKKNSTFKLNAKTPDESIREIEISFMAGNLTSLSIRTYDQVSNFFFSKQKVNSMIDTSVFSFEIPADTDVIDRTVLPE